MGKQKSKGPNLVAVPNKDLMQRMNFLYQVASHLSQQSGLFEENSDVKPSPKGSKKAKKRNGTPQDLAAFHVRSMKAIGTKSMVKMRGYFLVFHIVSHTFTGIQQSRGLYAKSASL